MRRRFIILPLFTASLGAAMFEQIIVQSDRVIVREEKGSMYRPLKTYVKGDALDVVSRDGTWLRVKTDAGEGWAYAAAAGLTSSTKFDAAGVAIDAAGGDARATEFQAGAAAKGLDPFSYASSKSYDAASLKRLESMRQSITYEQWSAFVKEGKLKTKGAMK